MSSSVVTGHVSSVLTRSLSAQSVGNQSLRSSSLTDLLFVPITFSIGSAVETIFAVCKVQTCYCQYYADFAHVIFPSR